MIIPSADVAIVALAKCHAVGSAGDADRRIHLTLELARVREDWRKLYARAFAEMDSRSGELVGKSPPANPPGATVGRFTSAATPTTTGVRHRRRRTVGSRFNDRTAPRRHPLRHWDGDVFALRTDQ